MNKTWGLTWSNLALKCPTHEWTDKIGHNLKPIMKIMRFANRRGRKKFKLKSIIFPKKECFLELSTSVDGLEAYYGPNNPNNMYERKEMNAMDEEVNIYGCITYICLLNESDGLIFDKDSFDWKKFMKSKGLKDAAEDWADK